MRYLIFDTETTGFIIDGAPPTDPRQPWLLQLGWVVAEGDRAERVIDEGDVLLNWSQVTEVPAASTRVHGIDAARLRTGAAPRTVIEALDRRVRAADRVCAFNLAFDAVVVLAAYHRVGGTGGAFVRAKKACVMQSATDVCRVPKLLGTFSPGFKYPTLTEAYKLLVDRKGFAEAHSALPDARAAHRVLQALLTTETELIYEPPVVASPRPAAVVDTELKRLDSILNEAGDNEERLSEWERGFVADLVERREKYKETTRVSPKQWAILERIEEKLR